MHKMLSELRDESEMMEAKTVNEEKEKEKLQTYEQKHKAQLEK